MEGRMKCRMEEEICFQTDPRGLAVCSCLLMLWRVMVGSREVMSPGDATARDKVD